MDIATFIGLIGYSMAVLCLMLDIGRPDRFWHALMYWNTHSLLWEVTMCVTLYFSVLSLETLPILGSADFMQTRWPGFAAKLQSRRRKVDCACVDARWRVGLKARESVTQLLQRL